jgi:hypothetical protein
MWLELVLMEMGRDFMRALSLERALSLHHLLVSVLH